MRNKVNNNLVKPGYVAYMELRFFGGRWYESLGLPNAPNSSYVLKYQYTHWYLLTHPWTIIIVEEEKAVQTIAVYIPTS